MTRYSKGTVLSQQHPAFVLSEVSPIFPIFPIIASLTIRVFRIDCTGWSRTYGHYRMCTHRQRRGLEARKKDMFPLHIRFAEDEIASWEDQIDGPRLERERLEREVKRQVMLQSKILLEEQGSSTEIQCDKKQ